MKKRTGTPWMPAPEYGRLLPRFTVNLMVKDVERAVEFYKAVLNGTDHYHDVDFAALNVGGVEFMLHADHTFEEHPWESPLQQGERRGLGVELRILGVDPEEIEALARKHGAGLVKPPADKPHGWREIVVEDPDGYYWAVGVTADAP